MIRRMESMAFSQENAGHRQRLRERFINAGLAAFAPHEILELLLTYSIPQRDVKPLAKSLIAHFGSLENVLSAPREQLVEVSGIKDNSAVLLMLTQAIPKYFIRQDFVKSDLIANPSAALKFVRSKITDWSCESLFAIYMDEKNYAVKYDVWTGDKGNVLFHLPHLARSILICKAHGVLLVHNHPSGNAKPSEKDLETTRSTKHFLENMDMLLVDHLVITKFSHVSLLNRMGCVFKNYFSERDDSEL